MQTNIPSNIVSGLTVEFTKRLADYSPAEWTLSYHLRGTQAANATATDNGDGSFLVSLTAKTGGMTPVALTPGRFFFQAYVTNILTISDKRLIDSGRINVTPDLSSVTTPFDARSSAELMIEAIDALMEGKATRDQMSYTIGQRTLSRIPVPDLLEFRKYYIGIVESEAIKARVKKGLPAFENIHVKFRQPR